MRRVIFLDIDGVLLLHHNKGLSAILTEKPELLPGTIDKINEWEAKGHKIILTTGRMESMRRITERQLESFGIFYSMLIMEVSGDRVLINDKKPDGRIAASVINLDRNTGIGEIEL